MANKESKDTSSLCESNNKNIPELEEDCLFLTKSQGEAVLNFGAMLDRTYRELATGTTNEVDWIETVFSQIEKENMSGAFAYWLVDDCKIPTKLPMKYFIRLYSLIPTKYWDRRMICKFDAFIEQYYYIGNSPAFELILERFVNDLNAKKEDPALFAGLFSYP
jgi:hypothetical protein